MSKKKKKYQGKNYEYLGFNDLLFGLWGIPLISFLSPMVFFGNSLSDTGGKYWIFFSITFVFCLGYLIIDRQIIIHFRKKYPLLQDTKKRLLWSSGIIITYTLISYMIVDGHVDDFIRRVTDFCNPPREQHGLAAAATITLFILVLYESLYFSYKWKASSLNNERLKKKNAQSQLETLKSQVNPHFLFNSLNTLSALIPKDQELSIKFVGELSKVYRNILDIKNKDLVTLEEECGRAESYLFLLKIRFEDSLIIKKEIDQSKLHYFVIPLSLQMLIENAIKHNIASKNKPLNLTIRMDSEMIYVENNLQRKNTGDDSTKTGLDNINKRYQMLFNKSIVVNRTDKKFSVGLPLIKVYDEADINN